MSPFEDDVRIWLEEFSLEDILERCEITPEEVLCILLEQGRIQIPEELL